MLQESAITVTVARAAELLNLSPRSVAGYIASGELPSVKLGRRRLVRVKDLERFVQRSHGSAERKGKRDGR